MSGRRESRRANGDDADDDDEADGGDDEADIDDDEEVVVEDDDELRSCRTGTTMVLSTRSTSLRPKNAQPSVTDEAFLANRQCIVERSRGCR